RSPGEAIDVRSDRYKRYDGMTVHGIFYGPFHPPATSTPTAVLLFVTAALVVVLTGAVAAFVMAQAVWARHDITTLKHDLQADPVVVVGTYDGSWVPKSLLLRPQRTSPIAAGFP